MNMIISVFKEHLKITKQSDKTIKAYTIHINFFFSWLKEKGIDDPKEITGEDIKEYQTYLNQRNYSSNTIHIKLRSIKRFFDYLETTNCLLYNPAEKIIYPKLGDRLPKNILTEEEIKRLLRSPNTSTLIGIRDKTILELLYTSGIRLNECANIKIDDIDYKGGYLRINQGKGNKDRIVPIGKKACEYLKEYLLRIRPRYAGIDERSLFISEYKGPLKKQSIAVVVKKYGRRSNIKNPVTVHTLRRTFATHMLKNGAHPLYIQRILGHSGSHTLNRYVKVAGIDLKRTHKKTHPREKDSIKNFQFVGQR